jgi:phosphoribosylformimino-5-aminoimidazole carboxamide ribotide isomerase
MMTSGFEVIPAIDLHRGRVVRLEQGDFERETVFHEDPGRAVGQFVQAGARLLHVVDLDGARAGEPAQLAELQTIVAATGGHADVEAAGGIRSVAAVDAVLDAGAHRIAFGTAALRDPELVRATVSTHGPERVAVAVDVRGDKAVGDAWKPGAAGVSPEDLVRRLADLGVVLFEVTAVDRDGLLGGPDLDLLERLVRLERGGIIASGGIRHVADIAAASEIGCAGAIVGRALYDGSFDLAEAIRMVGAGGALRLDAGRPA